MPDEIDLTPDDEAILQEIWQERATRRKQAQPAVPPPEPEQTHDVD